MKNKFLPNIEKKNVLIFLSSTILTIFCVYIMLTVAEKIYYISWMHTFMRNIKYRIGIFPLTIGTSIIFFLLFFYLMNRILSTKEKLEYIEEISIELQKIAQGRFDTKIPIRSSYELGELARNINMMSTQLQISIQDERNAEKAKNELITSISHDLRTPLTSILGYLELIANNQYKDEVELAHYIDIAYKKSHKLKKLIDELFEFTSISYDPIKMQLSNINLAKLLEQLIEELFPIFQDTGVKYRLFKPQQRICISGDGDMLVRVFENIITNAIRYGKDGKYVDIELVQKSKYAIITITNYGNMISKQHLPYIFERFYRVDPSRSESTGGAGLGLAIAKSIVELHEGKISVCSNNQRTTFKVILNIVE